MDETVKESLKFLLDCNDPDSKGVMKKDQKGHLIVGTQKDLMEINYERLVNIADVLGMSYLYLKEGD
ncbi:hypothetical protein [uncultured Lentilactobacillus sp.]|uniref:hypothetical protein n=1 Tax=uncultured Lentilactobacillus sp. TaxID=2805375 RepID=UPI0025990CA8|nr:hypothetical protein [uncultured Lentilactobacillus sp.]